MFQRLLAFGYALIDALTGGPADVQALYALVQQKFSQSPDGLSVYLSLFVVAGVKGGENALIFRNIFHIVAPLLE